MSLSTGEIVRIRIDSFAWSSNNGEIRFVIIDVKDGTARVAEISSVRTLMARDLVGVALCEKCGQELPEKHD